MEIDPGRIEKTRDRLNREAGAGGYLLNPDSAFVRELVEGLLTNEDRYGYPACPCRLAAGDRTDDLDIICPCDYRDADIADHGACYCGLYVSQDIVDGKRKLTRVPERRPPEEKRAEAPSPAQRMSAAEPGGPGGSDGPAGTSAPGASQPAGPSPQAPALPDLSGLNKYPLWRCRVCGYLCSRGQPPEVCPICRAKKDRFERLL